MNRRAGAIRGWIAAIAVVAVAGTTAASGGTSGAGPGQAGAIKSPELRD